MFDVFLRRAGLSYGKYAVFQNIDLTMEAGCWTCLLGGSGVGKTSLLKMVAGLTSGRHVMTSGEVTCGDGLPLHGRVSWMAQQDLLLPILLITQAIPVFALAPVLMLWFGYGMASKVVMTVLVIFFPVATCCYDGLRHTHKGWLDLAHTMGAGRYATHSLIRWPAALPALSSGLRVAVVIAPIGAVVGEWVGSSAGLGYLMLQANARLWVDLMFRAGGLFRWALLTCIFLPMMVQAAPAPKVEELRLMLEWFVNPDHGPIIIAKQKGYFEQEGVKVTLQEPASLMTGKVDALLGAYRNFELNNLKLYKNLGKMFYMEELSVPACDELIFIAHFALRPAAKDVGRYERYAEYLVEHKEIKKKPDMKKLMLMLDLY
ncbi:ABC transporter permease subunit [Sansalvadorimonas sp. 2012CJ34-2]|uniref:ABC transporter permease subunit n=1 Tax=Parendozoicomonas callyspongiae TaxID=2942213 RepID=A0ABT0PDB5_9GAMM|nr:ABC transporter permease subunit [Sansalvadorimonas sp. 2012CJ34-2]MCL6269372.1 ABC transporter permease subunit [Sansalvadorimonas sp. 2012CJ34-2]